jgi:hypothetical protein
MLDLLASVSTESRKVVIEEVFVVFLVVVKVTIVVACVTMSRKIGQRRHLDLATFSWNSTNHKLSTQNQFKGFSEKFKHIFIS